VAAITLSIFNQKLLKKKIFSRIVSFLLYVLIYADYRMVPRLCQQIGAMHVEATTMAIPETWHVTLVGTDTSSCAALA